MISLVSHNVENCSLYPSLDPSTDFSKVHLYIELLTKVTKRSEVPEFTRKMALEAIALIPFSALQISTEGSWSSREISGSDVHINSLKD